MYKAERKKSYPDHPGSTAGAFHIVYERLLNTKAVCEQVEGGKTASAGRAVEAGRNGRLFGQAVQDRNEGGKLGAKSGAAQSQGGRWEGGSGHGG